MSARSVRGVIAVASSIFLCAVANTTERDRGIPPEVRYKSGYVNSIPKPPDFTSAMLWGIAIGDARVPGYEKAQVEISHTKLTCRVDGKDVVLNDDKGNVRGGLYRRHPWFGSDAHDPMPLDFSETPTSRKKGAKRGAPQKEKMRSVILRVGSKPGLVWHFWAASPRAAIPAGHLEGCTVTVSARVADGALLQVGLDYWRNPTVGYESGGNNHEAGAATGTSLPKIGRRLFSQTSSAESVGNKPRVGRTVLCELLNCACFRLALVMDHQDREICAHLSDKSVRPTRACKIEDSCSSPNNSTSS